ncbi:MAG: Holliday junction resolvase RuvX [Candidatus Komeilibacteria bacterium CG_4_10_14_0_2_um_filter_37_10]|uniref:Putative pre-16S rRNA nuclease n=1 Tax=Candidatus Komeilibacteria bacterium CG_4_10_14_0_2_um_filter_37_10 TaxID=1974470 RepID=A0A2M7VG32_9BACT|nr:MAG: Holliday junction resolvase RuvX [Candidatus Komeilibacteria bacterium CG_4_10_14_0_2_um_filter_37_10]PJA92741.1 MAG: Holliday junction resolvase RuvX [Candidatus Komeilibacteria bacterium CG_4_9_14_3_um_filter_37_5]
MKVLGIDFGSKKVGLALGDTSLKLAIPWQILAWADNASFWDKFKSLVAEEKVELLVVGWPLDLRSQMTPQTEVVAKFIEQLQNLNYLVEKVDERLTTKAAKKLGHLREDDAVAAMEILQTYFDRHE